MKSNEIELTQGPLAKNILRFSIPLVLSNLLQVLFNISDIVIVGRFAGSLALGSVGSTSQLLFAFTGLLMGIGNGINVIAAYYIGSKKQKDLDDSVHTSLIFCLISGFALMFFGLLISKNILILIKTKEILLDGAITYFRIYMFALPGLALFNYGNAILNATGDTKRPFIYLSIAGIINIILNIFFVAVLKMDCDGVALATVISQYISAFLVMNVLIKGINGIKLHKSNMKVNSIMLKQIIKIGIPSGLQNVVFSFANTFVQVGVNSFDEVMVSGTAVCSNLDNLVYTVMNAFYIACASFIGQNFGAQQKERVKKTYLLCTFFSFSIALFIGILYLIFGDFLLGLFTKEQNVINAGMERLRILSLSFCVSAFMDNTIAANRGLGKSFIPSIIVIMGSCVFRVIWVLTIFAYYKTIASLFLLYVFSWSITAIAEIIYFIITFNKMCKTSMINN